MTLPLSYARSASERGSTDSLLGTTGPRDYPVRLGPDRARPYDP